MFKKIILLSAILVSTYHLTAQFGITGGYRVNEAKDWKLINETNNSETELLGDGFSLGVDYWFRLKNKRIEFTPEANLSIFKQGLDDGVETKVNMYSLFLKTNIYLFDLLGDCDCPTFSKQGNSLAKGFFVQLSPGVSYFNLNSETPESNGVTTIRDISLSFGAALGLDIGFSDLITVSPLVGGRYFSPVTWSGVSSIAHRVGSEISLKSEESSIFQLFAGLRIGIRLDEY